ncbi:hypothetical protein CIPAW_10G079600 [Carya illinoinensis]|uniref:NADH-ubiquinone oxidoreductase 21kDa subunit N-terminal domain-containing protein n=1 Tax=Carya illinoinensis TaxID=32201 RepID=A0A8T1PBS6_CARIL|nr:hypothetical protein CIPAW_10G079600 [Carya illinoinensis]
MNTDITASTKPEYPVIDRNPPFTKVVGNFNFLDYLRFTTITGVSVTVGYLSGIKPGIRGPSMVTGGLIGLMGGFMYAYQNSAGRIMGFFPNDDEVLLGGLTSSGCFSNIVALFFPNPSYAWC